MKTNKTFRRAALEKLFLIACLLLIAVWILTGQTVELNPKSSSVAGSPGKPADYLPAPAPEPKLSMAELYARLCDEDVKPWSEPRALPMNMERVVHERAVRNFKDEPNRP